MTNKYACPGNQWIFYTLNTKFSHLVKDKYTYTLAESCYNQFLCGSLCMICYYPECLSRDGFTHDECFIKQTVSKRRLMSMFDFNMLFIKPSILYFFLCH